MQISDAALLYGLNFAYDDQLLSLTESRLWTDRILQNLVHY